MSISYTGEQPERPLGLQDTQPIGLAFGDVIISPRNNGDYPMVVVEAADDGTNAFAVAIMEKKGVTTPRGLSGTVRLPDVKSIIGYKSRLETARIIGRIMMPGNQINQTVVDQVLEEHPE